MAKKKLSRDQKRKQKKRRRSRSQPTRNMKQFGKRFLNKMDESGAKTQLVYNPPDQLKMSQVIENFIAPYQQQIPEDEASMRKLLTTALIAWNTALLPPEERAEELAKFADTFPKETREDFYAIVQEMIERKEQHFGHIDRRVLDFELTDHGDDFHLSVISTLSVEK